MVNNTEELEMEHATCPVCETRIEVKDRYIKGSADPLENFKEPCGDCAYNTNDEDKMPCRFCVHV